MYMILPYTVDFNSTSLTVFLLQIQIIITLICLSSVYYYTVCIVVLYLLDTTQLHRFSSDFTFQLKMDLQVTY